MSRVASSALTLYDVKDGDNADVYKFVYKDFLTKPDKPTDNAATGWMDSIPTNINNTLWHSQGKQTEGSGNYVWQEPVQIAAKDGKGIVGITEAYQLGTSATVAPTGSWASTFAGAGAVSVASPYMWNRTTTSYTEGTNTTVTTMIAAKGETGGVSTTPGPRGSANLAWSTDVLGNFSPSEMVSGHQGALNDMWDYASNYSASLASNIDGDTLVVSNTTGGVDGEWTHIFTWEGTAWSALIAQRFSGSIIVDDTISAGHLQAGSVNASKLDISAVSGSTGVSTTIDPLGESPLRLSANGSPIFEVQYDAYAVGGPKTVVYIDGKLSANTVNIAAIQEEARKQINPYYLGTVNGNEVENTNVGSSTSTISTILSSVTTLGGGCNLSWRLEGSSTTTPTTTGFITAPVWKVYIYRNSLTGPSVTIRTYTGTTTITHTTQVWNEGECSYDATYYIRSDLLIDDSFYDANAPATEIYAIKAVRQTGTVSLALESFKAHSPAFAPIESELVYTTLYEHATGYGNGNITLSEPFTNFDYLVVVGADDNNSFTEVYTQPTAIIEYSISHSTTGAFTIWSGGSSRYWIVTTNTSRDVLVDYSENSRIHKILGANLESKPI